MLQARGAEGANNLSVNQNLGPTITITITISITIIIIMYHYYDYYPLLLVRVDVKLSTRHV